MEDDGLSMWMKMLFTRIKSVVKDYTHRDTNMWGIKKLTEHLKIINGLQHFTFESGWQSF